MRVGTQNTGKPLTMRRSRAALFAAVPSQQASRDDPCPQRHDCLSAKGTASKVRVALLVPAEIAFGSATC